MKGHLADRECRQVRVGILWHTVLIVFLTVLYAFIFNLFPLHTYAGQEPKFPGLGAKQNKIDKYWSDYGKYLMDLKTIPAMVKQGTDLEKPEQVVKAAKDIWKEKEKDHSKRTFKIRRRSQVALDE